MFKLAMRNLLRHRKRSLITALGVAFGLAMMVFSNNLNEGVHQEMVRLSVSQLAGHVVVQPEGYQADPKPEVFLSEASAVAGSLQSALPEAVITRRSFLGGLLTSTSNSVGVAMTAIDPAVEPQVSDWQDKLSEGVYIEDDRDILLGWRLAESLDVELGDKVVLMSQGKDEMSSRMFRVKGLVRTGSDSIDGMMTVAHIDAAAELLGEEDVAHQVSAHLSDISETPTATGKAKDALAEVGGLEVMGWKEALPEVRDLVQLDEQMNHVFMGIIGFILALAVLNTVLMSVMERVREFGVLLALGMAPKLLARMVVLEGLILGLVACGFGLALGTAVTAPLVADGLDYSSMMGTEAVEVGAVAMSSVVPVAHYWSMNLAYTAAGVALVVFASLYPALRAARLRPVDAMRHV